jgi:hypothetical protein
MGKQNAGFATFAFIPESIQKWQVFWLSPAFLRLPVPTFQDSG